MVSCRLCRGSCGRDPRLIALASPSVELQCVLYFFVICIVFIVFASERITATEKIAICSGLLSFLAIVFCFVCLSRRAKTQSAVEEEKVEEGGVEVT